MLEVKLEGDKALAANLGAMSSRMKAEITRTVRRLSIELSAYVKERKLSGQVLTPRTGTLRRSITHSVTEGPDGVTGKVGTNVVYAAIHEYGGKTKPHVIEAKRGKALKFSAGGETIFRRKVRHPGSVMPERSFLRTALRENAGKITDELNKAVERVLKS